MTGFPFDAQSTRPLSHLVPGWKKCKNGRKANLCRLPVAGGYVAEASHEMLQRQQLLLHLFLVKLWSWTTPRITVFFECWTPRIIWMLNPKNNGFLWMLSLTSHCQSTQALLQSYQLDELDHDVIWPVCQPIFIQITLLHHFHWCSGYCHYCCCRYCYCCCCCYCYCCCWSH